MASEVARQIASQSTDTEEFGGCLMPVQYYQLVKRHSPTDGVHRLLYAVLEDAIRCYVATMNARSRQQRARFVEVQQWFRAKPSANSGPTGLFAFETLCEVLGIEPNIVRKRLKTLRLSQLPTRRHRRASPTSRGTRRTVRRRITAQEAMNPQAAM